MRQEQRALRKHGLKLHWREMDVSAKKVAMDLISRIDVAHIVVVAAPMDPKRQERARAKCMERLLAELGDLGISAAFLESHTIAQRTGHATH
ncbi:hypothetical protein [Glutamicibacter sp. NPDC087344]|uniref:hypothetical protein n=1 Tax=Glutamicibacter sp. NPDC087344 TaxID=3363994 RepID=UPI00380C7087